jgi:acid phosphatase (class A)
MSCNRWRIGTAWLALGLLLLARVAHTAEDWQQRLYSPTFMQKIDGKWIIVDCWHSRIIWDTRLDKDLTHWHTLESAYSAHDVVFDGRKYWVTEDSEHRAIVFYTFGNGVFHEAARLGNLGTRPHHLAYDSKSGSFLLLAATSGDMWRIRMQNGQPAIVHHTRLSFAQPEKPGFEIRSFTLHDGHFYFVSSIATQKIYVTTDDDSYRIVQTIDVPRPFADMQDLYFFPDGKVFITAWPGSVALVNRIQDVTSAKNAFARLGFRGSPYGVSPYARDFIIPEIGSVNGVALWRYANGQLTKIRDLTTFSAPHQSDIAKKAQIHFDVASQ